MEYCCVPLCSGWNDKGYFKVPFNKPFKWQKWTTACPFLLNFSSKELKCARICSKHFIPQQVAAYGKLRPNAVPSLCLPPSKASGDSEFQINKSSEEQHLTGKTQHSSKDMKLFIEPSINVPQFSLYPSSFVYIPLSPKNSNDSETVEIDTYLEDLSSDNHQESVSEQESPQKSSKKAQNYKEKQMSRLVTVGKQHLTIQPLTDSNNINKNIIPKTSQLEQENSSLEQKYLKTGHFKKHNFEVKEEIMDNINKSISRLKYICYTCLSQNRNLTKLSDVNDGINNLLYLISSSGEAYEELSNYVDEVYICWECKALMNRFRRFRNQVCKAQQQLKELKLKDNKYKTLSKLSTQYNYGYIPAEETTSVVEALKAEKNLTSEELNSLINKKHNGKKNNSHVVDNNVHYLTIQMSATELSEDLHIRKADPDFNATTHKCTTCIKTFNDEEELDMHMSDYHKVPQHVMCYICEAYVRSDWHEEHNYSHFIKYKCHRCYKDFYSSLEILEHLYEAHNIKDTFEEITKKKLQIVKELKVKPLVLYSPTGRTFCYICSQCNESYVTKTEIAMRCEPCSKILATVEPKCGNDSNYYAFDENSATGKKISKEVMRIEPTNKTKFHMPVKKRSSCTSFCDKVLCAQYEEKYLKDTTNHITYEHGYAETTESNRSKVKTDNRFSSLKLDSRITNTPQINVKNVSDEVHMDCEDIVKTISGQDDIETVEISDIENVQNSRYVTFNLSEFLKIPTNEITEQETNVTEQATDETKQETDVTEIKSVITESETEVTEEGIEEDFLSDPDNPTYKMIIKYQAHYTVNKMTVTEMQDSLEQRKSVPKFAEAMYKCELCIEIFDDHQKRQSHTMLLHVKPTSQIPHILCNICRVYIKERWFKEHRNNHFLKFFCHYCDFVTYNVLVIWNHLKLEHTCKVYSNKEMKWVKRRITLTNPGTCPLNVDVKANENSTLGYMCLQCNEFFPTLDLKTNHNRLNHRQYKAKAPKIKCSKCFKSFRRLAKLKEHDELKHKLPPVYSTCPICGKQVANMRIHKSLHKTPPMSCVECDRVYPNKKAYLYHLRYTTIHAGDKCHKYKCSFCDKRFIKKSIYLDHVNYRHRGISHECSLCHKMLSSAAQLWAHMKNVHCKAYKQYLCPTCGIVCKNGTVLRDHELYHSGNHVTCRLCGLQFRKYSSLRNHRTRAHKSSNAKKAIVVDIIEQ